MLAMHQSSPGAVANVPEHWPAGSSIERAQGSATLVLFAHPRCPCTRATLGELEEIVAHCQGRVDLWIVFFKPSASEANWDKTDLWRTAAAIPGARVIGDEDGCEAARFGAMTSGHVMVYEPRGTLLFSGGITSARGHAGDSPGHASVEACLLRGTTTCNSAPVFGCPIAIR